jgi:hypothetical protein
VVDLALAGLGDAALFDLLDAVVADLLDMAVAALEILVGVEAMTMSWLRLKHC